jgi:excisionase family DNA binding protein
MIVARHSSARNGLLSVDEAAEYLGIRPSTLKHWAQTNKIEFVRIGKFLKFRREGLEAFIARRTRPPQEEA